MTTPGDPNNSQPWGGTPPGGERPPYGEQPPGGHSYGEQPPPGGQPYGEQSHGGQHYGEQPPGGQPPGGYPPGGQPPYGAPPYQAPYGKRPAGGGLGTAALVLGIVSLFLLLICGLGVLTAIVGLIIGIVAVAKHSNRGRAIAGIVLSALTLVLAVIGFMWFLGTFSECFNLPTQADVQQCVEQKLGVNVAPSQ
ncbi:DUF4190 domain-containing protein [Sphaerisporangium dianthi]|uniref:DUF4190 domain-containing protein n=1 Tax=Sphaerisporangium dianthi TaxID=1436120 RepID=A0ABV9CU21_9ACTN